MILTCPNCNARFLINAAALRPSGREVRCGRCRHQWFATPPDEESVPAPEEISGQTPEETKAAPDRVPPPLPPPEPVYDEPRPIPPGSNLPAIPKRRRSVGIILGWLLFVLVLIALGVLVAERDRVMSAYPETRPVFGALGFEVPPIDAGLKITDESCSRTVQEGLPVLICEGKVSNTSQHARHVPTLRGALRDAAGRELQSWTFTVPDDSLGPGESVAFRTEVRQPAAAATELSITFVAGE